MLMLLTQCNNILKKNTHSHPLLCLNSVNSNDLHNILDYIYNGEIQIFQDDLNSFLATAKRFQLEGLNKEQEDNDEMTHVKNENIENDFMPLDSNSENDSNTENDQVSSPNPIPKTPVALNLMNEKELT